MTTLMVVDDDVHQLKLLDRVFGAMSEYEVYVFQCAEKALKSAEKRQYDVIISDLRMPDIDGVTFLSRMKRLQPKACRIMMSAHCDRQALYGAINVAHAERFLEKPCSVHAVMQVVQEVLRDKQYQEEAVEI